MAEYIDKEKTIELLKNYKNHVEKYNKLYISEGVADYMLKRIEEVFSVDGVPLKYGKWKYPTRWSWLRVCSECGVDGGFFKKKYCPNCGAKMNGGENHD